MVVLVMIASGVVCGWIAVAAVRRRGRMARGRGRSARRDAPSEHRNRHPAVAPRAGRGPPSAARRRTRRCPRSRCGHAGASAPVRRPQRRTRLRLDRLRGPWSGCGTRAGCERWASRTSSSSTWKNSRGSPTRCPPHPTRGRALPGMDRQRPTVSATGLPLPSRRRTAKTPVCSDSRNDVMTVLTPGVT